jgi:D-sedoheptulose 7-phosphate isomerase
LNTRFSPSQLAGYASRLADCIRAQDWQPVCALAEDMVAAWNSGRQVFICGNGGSAANAIHWANDYCYPVAKSGGRGMKMHALPANASTLTCIGNDLGYDRIFSRQLESQAEKGDLLIVLSGSGNSPNVLRALETARELGMKSYAIVAFSGGKAKALADVAIHTPIEDMQIAEDIQMSICHMLLQALAAARTKGEA